MSMIFRVHAQIFHARIFRTRICCLMFAQMRNVSDVLRTNFLRVRVVVPYGFAIRGKSGTYGLCVSLFLRGFSGLPTCDMREYGVYEIETGECATAPRGSRRNTGEIKGIRSLSGHKSRWHARYGGMRPYTHHGPY